MNKREELLLKVIGCISFLDSNGAYLQQLVLAKIENPPMTSYRDTFMGILKYNKKALNEIEKLIDELDKLPVTISKDGKNITAEVGKLTKMQAAAYGIDCKAHPCVLKKEGENDSEVG